MPAMFDWPLPVLPRCDHHSFDVHIVQTSQSETPQAVKVIGSPNNGSTQTLRFRDALLYSSGS
jgi:hypothetical protein